MTARGFFRNWLMNLCELIMIVAMVAVILIVFGWGVYLMWLIGNVFAEVFNVTIGVVVAFFVGLAYISLIETLADC